MTKPQPWMKFTLPQFRSLKDAAPRPTPKDAKRSPPTARALGSGANRAVTNPSLAEQIIKAGAKARGEEDEKTRKDQDVEDEKDRDEQDDQNDNDVRGKKAKKAKKAEDDEDNDNEQAREGDSDDKDDDEKREKAARAAKSLAAAILRAGSKARGEGTGR